MGIIELALVAIKGLSVVLNNPALGGGSSVKLNEASDLLALLGELLTRGDEAHEELVAFTKVVEEMAAQGRQPTTAEWNTLRGRSDAAHDVIQAAAAATTEEETEQVFLEDLTKAELLEQAAKDGVSVPSSATKAQIIELLEAVEE
jgi:uncharacterized protein YceH (UPF0502 family)